MPSLRTACQVVARIAVLLCTAWLLVATSPPPDEPRCDKQLPSAAFAVSGSCGSGVIVVHTERWNGDIWVEDPDVLGLPPAAASVGESDTYDRPPGQPLPGHGLYTGEKCPYDLRDGNWEVYGRGGIASAPPGRDAGARDAGIVAGDMDVCRATAELDGSLRLDCFVSNDPTCTARLDPL